MENLWEGCIGFEGQLTGDGRYIEPGALMWDTLPMPIRYAAEDFGAHDGAQVVGHINTIERRDGGVIWATGDFDLEGIVGAEAARHVKNQLTNGVSMDLDDVGFEVRLATAEVGASPEQIANSDEVMVTTHARVRSSTIVAIPAFEGARINLVGGSEDITDDTVIESSPAIIELPMAAPTAPALTLSSVLQTFGYNPTELRSSANGAWMPSPFKIVTDLEAELSTSEQGNKDPKAEAIMRQATTEAQTINAQNDPGDVAETVGLTLTQLIDGANAPFGTGTPENGQVGEALKLLEQLSSEDWSTFDPTLDGSNHSGNPAATVTPDAAASAAPVDASAPAAPAATPAATPAPAATATPAAAPAAPAAAPAAVAEPASAPATVGPAADQIIKDFKLDATALPISVAATDFTADQISAFGLQSGDIVVFVDNAPVGLYDAQGTPHAYTDGAFEGRDTAPSTDQPVPATAAAKTSTFAAGDKYVEPPMERDVFLAMLNSLIAIGAEEYQAPSDQLATALVLVELGLTPEKATQAFYGNPDDPNQPLITWYLTPDLCGYPAVEGAIEEVFFDPYYDDDDFWTTQHSATFNWVQDVGGLPAYIKDIEKAIRRDNPEIPEGLAISMAVAAVKRWARGGSANGKLGGPKVSKEVQAKALAALADWEAKKTASHVDGKSAIVTTMATYRDYSEETRKKMADKGEAMPDGSFPIANKTDLENAIQSAGRASDVDEVHKFIKKRAKDLDATDLIPDDWNTTALEQYQPEDRNSLVASGGHLAAPIAPPASWFENPKLSGPTPMVVTKDGRVYGHLATWDVCHLAMPNGIRDCVTAPHSGTDYSMFHLGVVETAEGTEVPVGRITMKTEHAGSGWNARRTMAHYENTGLAIADVHAGEDSYGIWFAGALRPDATPTQIRALKASPLSGDWRDHPRTGQLELVMGLAVNQPGFPVMGDRPIVPRPHGLVASGAVKSLMAAGMLAPRQVIAPDKPGALSVGDLKYLQKLAQRERDYEASEMKMMAMIPTMKLKVEDMAASLASAANPMEVKSVTTSPKVVLKKLPSVPDHGAVDKAMPAKSIKFKKPVPKGGK